MLSGFSSDFALLSAMAMGGRGAESLAVMGGARREPGREAQELALRRVLRRRPRAARRLCCHRVVLVCTTFGARAAAHLFTARARGHRPHSRPCAGYLGASLATLQRTKKADGDRLSIHHRTNSGRLTWGAHRIITTESAMS